MMSWRHSEIACRAADTISSRGSVLDQWDKAGESASSFTDGSVRKGLGSVVFVSCGLCFGIASKLAKVCLNGQRDVEPLIRSYCCTLAAIAGLRPVA